MYPHFAMLLMLTASWYASPNGSGNGSINSPWALNVALTNSSVTAGDTVYLRGGTYSGLGYVSTLSGTSGNRVTVRSYPGEWAVISDGVIGYLGTALDAATSSGVITNSETAQLPLGIFIDSEVISLNIPHSGNTWTLDRGWASTTATSHSMGTPVIFINSIIQHTGSYVTFRDFEITSVLSTNRNVGTNWWLGAGLNLASPGVGNSAVDLIIHNVGHPGIGFWSQGASSELNGCIIWGTGMYDYSPSYGGGVGTPRGAGVYSQNESGMATIKNCISFRNFTYGAKVYGETGPVHDFQFLGNFAFDNANGNNPQLEGTSGSTATSNVWFNGNQVLGTLSLTYASTGNSSQHVINNTLIESSMLTAEQADSVYTNNTIFNMRGVVVSELTTAENGYISSLLSKAGLNILWDYNTWHTGDGSSDNAWRFDTTDGASGWMTFTNWQAYSGFDLHSTITTNWPTDYLSVTVQVLDYDANRWHIAVVNTDTNLTGTTVNLASSCGFSVGQYYRLRDAQNYFVPIAQGFYGGGTINLPLNLTNVSTINGALTHMTNEHTNVKNPGLFNAFVLERIAGMNRVAAVRAGQIRGK